MVLCLPIFNIIITLQECVVCETVLIIGLGIAMVRLQRATRLVFTSIGGPIKEKQGQQGTKALGNMTSLMFLPVVAVTVLNIPLAAFLWSRNIGSTRVVVVCIAPAQLTC